MADASKGDHQDAGGSEVAAPGPAVLPEWVDGPELRVAREGALAGVVTVLLALLATRPVPGLTWPWGLLALTVVAFAVSCGAAFRWSSDGPEGSLHRTLRVGGYDLPAGSFEPGYFLAATVDGVKDGYAGVDGRTSDTIEHWSYMPVLVDRQGGIHRVAVPGSASLSVADQEARRVASTLGVPFVPGVYSRHARVEIRGETAVVVHDVAGRDRPGSMWLLVVIATLMVVLGGGL